MKWRRGKADGSSAESGALMWARSGRWRLWRILPLGEGYMVPGLIRWVDGRNVRRRFGTIYGARMAAECEKRRCA